MIATVQAADVDAQLQRVRAHDAQQLAAAQSALDGSPLGRQVAAAIAADPIAAARVPPGTHLAKSVRGTQLH
ncbi:MAG: hypothetical protein U0869_07105 [Chloroflexota bacterium]